MRFIVVDDVGCGCGRSGGVGNVTVGDGVGWVKLCCGNARFNHIANTLSLSYLVGRAHQVGWWRLRVSVLVLHVAKLTNLI